MEEPLPPQIDQIRRTLISGNDEDRQKAVDDLVPALSEDDRSFLRSRLVSDLRGEFSPRAGEKSESAADTPFIRSWMITALAVVATAQNRDVVDLLLSYLDDKFETNEWVQYWALAAAYNLGVPVSRSWEHHNLPFFLSLAIMAANGSERPLSSLRGGLRDSASDVAWKVLRALRIVAVPALIEPVCQILKVRPSKSVQQPSNFDVYDAFQALSHPKLLSAAAPVLAQQVGVEESVQLAIQAVNSGPRRFVRKFAGLLQLMPQDRVRQQLQAGIQSSSAETRQAATALLECLPAAVPEGRPAVAGFASDIIPETGRPLSDELGIQGDVRNLASVLIAKSVHPPLAVGLFGDWGSGKSYFMESMYREIEEVRSLARTSQKTEFHGEVIQIRFNAWHYADSNLWASLVSHIFDELAESIQQKEPPEETRRRLVKELESAKQMQKDAQEEKDKAVQARASSEVALGDAVRKRQQKEIQISDIRVPDLLDVLTQEENQGLREKLSEVLNSLGYPSAVRSVEELEDAYRNAFTIAGRVRSLFLSVWDKKNRTAVFFLAAAIVVGVPLTGWILSKVLELHSLASISGLVVEVSGVVYLSAKKLKSILAVASEQLSKLEGRRDDILKLLEAKRQQVSKHEVRMKKELEALRVQEDSARRRFEAAGVKIRDIQQKIDDIDAGRSLSQFILERAQGQDYRKLLGIISMIRKDFERLTTLLKNGEAGFEKVGRIILYVDDLDRCSAEKVVEVMQAVHLLLAMPIFVVVVAVDLRWLLHSLDSQYSAFRSGDIVVGEKDPRRPEWTTSPQLYLEKIFQIPFNVRPMSGPGFQNLISALLPCTMANETKSPNQASTSMTAHGTSQDAISNAAPTNVPLPNATAQTANASTVDPMILSATANASPSPSQPQQQASAEPERDLNPDSLRIQKWETAFAQHMFNFVVTPRSAKRFTNIYRLLKAPLTGAELRIFEGTEAVPGQFQAAMLLLAIVTGMPGKALDLFPAIVNPLNNGTDWRKLFKDNLELTNDQQAEIDAVRLPADIRPFVKWAPDVARFSFEIGKAIAIREIQPKPLKKRTPVPRKRVSAGAN